MNARQLLLTLAAFAAATPPALAAPPDAAMNAAMAGAKSAIAGVVAATNSNDAAKVGSYFATDAVVVDENTPFVWKGANAGSAWWQSVQHVIAGGTLHAAAGPLIEYRADTRVGNAYAVVPLRITVSLHGKTMHESGLWALTLHRYSGGWKITTASWATSRP